jgi:hypothetical protein
MIEKKNEVVVAYRRDHFVIHLAAGRRGLWYGHPGRSHQGDGPLGRLHKNGYVLTLKGEPIPERGGRSKVYYRLSREGIKALREIQQVNAVIWDGIGEIELEEE